ncbi:hypothetical protein ACIQ4I_11900 [Rummeliibacillus sp. NPDC094406]|uniref:hypothetical protein n=1 Tax=Rummeliibacillus sp. NPDC094406 TaxID=3364511 RepID=UPI00381B586D
MSHQLDLFEYVDKQANLMSINKQINSLLPGQEITFSNISIRKTKRFFETLQSDVFHECFREQEECMQFIKVYLESGEYLK